MTKFRIIDIDVTKRVSKELGRSLRSVRIPRGDDIRLSCEIEMEKSDFDAIDADKIFLAKLYEKVGQRYNKAIADVVQEIRKTDAEAHRLHRRGRSARKVRNQLKDKVWAHLAMASGGIEYIVQESLDEYRKQCKLEGKSKHKFRSDIGVSVFSGVVGAGGAVVGVFATITGNIAGVAGIVAGIQGLVSSVVTIVTKIKTKQQDIEKVAGDLDRRVMKIKMAYKKGESQTGKNKNKVNFLDALLNTHMSRIKKIEIGITALKTKLQKLRRNLKDVLKGLTEAMSESTKLEKEIAKLNRQARGSDNENLKKELSDLKTKAKDLHRNIDSTLTWVIDDNHIIEEFEKALVIHGKAMKELRKGKGEFVKTMTNVATITLTLGANISGGPGSKIIETLTYIATHIESVRQMCSLAQQAQLE